MLTTTYMPFEGCKDVIWNLLTPVNDLNPLLDTVSANLSNSSYHFSVLDLLFWIDENTVYPHFPFSKIKSSQDNWQQSYLKSRISNYASIPLEHILTRVWSPYPFACFNSTSFTLIWVKSESKATCMYIYKYQLQVHEKQNHSSLVPNR